MLAKFTAFSGQIGFMANNAMAGNLRAFRRSRYELAMLVLSGVRQHRTGF
jgi:hypothetical protein